MDMFAVIILFNWITICGLLAAAVIHILLGELLNPVARPVIEMETWIPQPDLHKYWEREEVKEEHLRWMARRKATH